MPKIGVSYVTLTLNPYRISVIFKTNTILKLFLRGRVKFPIDGVEANACFLVRDPCGFIQPSGGSGETPEPTVIVWMGEGMFMNKRGVTYSYAYIGDSSIYGCME